MSLCIALGRQYKHISSDPLSIFFKFFSVNGFKRNRQLLLLAIKQTMVVQGSGVIRIFKFIEHAKYQIQRTSDMGDLAFA